MSQWCRKHWDMLRAEIDERGMGDMVSANGDILAMKMDSELKGEEETKEMFDPLMRVFFMVESRALQMLGVIAADPQFGCPICFLNEARTPDGGCGCKNPDCPAKEPGSIPDHETWIVGDESATASVQAMAKERGWIE